MLVDQDYLESISPDLGVQGMAVRPMGGSSNTGPEWVVEFADWTVDTLPNVRRVSAVQGTFRKFLWFLRYRSLILIPTVMMKYWTSNYYPQGVLDGWLETPYF